MKLALISALVASAATTSFAADCGSCTGCLWTYSGGSQCFDASAAPQVACDGWGAGYTWCGSGSTTAPETTAPVTTPTTTTKPATTSTPTTATPITTPTPTSTGTSAPTTGTLYSPYIDLAMGTKSTLVSRMNTAGVNAITLAFATGECGSENWGGAAVSDTLEAIKLLIAAKKKYIISTGGAAGAFSCGSDTNFIKFINTYNSEYLVGIDFDIEAGQSQATVQALVQRVKNAQSSFPNLRYSFTVATLGPSAGGNSLNVYGTWTIDAIKAAGLDNYLINLMTMDFGSPGQWICVVVNGQCEMGQSAVQAAKNLNAVQGIPYNKMEITPMIGGNDIAGEVFTIADVTTVTDFVKANKVAGVHFWSLDRDVDCAVGAASPTCNSYGQAGTLGFSKTFASNLA